MNELAELLNKTHPLSPQDIKLLISAGEPLELPKGELLIRADVVDTRFYILVRGLLRAFVPDGERDTTIWFSAPGEVVFSTWGFVEGAPSPISIGASADSLLLRYSRRRIEQLFLDNPAIGQWGRKILMKLLLTSDQTVVDFSIPNAAKRYEVLLEKMPDLLRHVPLKEIAGFLGVTPQSLSRIRAAYGRKK